MDGCLKSSLHLKSSVTATVLSSNQSARRGKQYLERWGVRIIATNRCSFALETQTVEWYSSVLETQTVEWYCCFGTTPSWMMPVLFLDTQTTKWWFCPALNAQNNYFDGVNQLSRMQCLNCGSFSVGVDQAIWRFICASVCVNCTLIGIINRSTRTECQSLG